MEKYEELLKQNCKRLDASELLDFYDKLEQTVKHLNGCQTPPRALIDRLESKRRLDARTEILRRMQR